MVKQAPNLARLGTMVLFALSCFGLLMFLWQSFGGAVPLQPKGYRVEIPFRSAGQLVEQAEVRVSGVRIGEVVDIQPGDGATRAIVQIEPKYAPLPSDMRAVLRQKTLLGETFIELTPGTPRATRVPEGGSLAAGNVQEQVELDQILQAFTPDTRKELGSFLRSFGTSVAGRQSDINGAVGRLPVLAERASGVLGVLDQQRRAVRQLSTGGRDVLDVIGSRDREVQGIVRDGGTVLNATAALPGQLRSTVRTLPTLVTGLRSLTRAQQRLFPILEPTARRLQPTARRIVPILDSADALAPQLRTLGSGLDAVTTAAPRGLTAARQLLSAARPALRQVDPLVGSITPIMSYVGLYRREISSSFAHVASASEHASVSPVTGKLLSYIRLLTPIDDETFGTAGRRAPTVRSNPYRAPDGLDADPSKRASFGCENTSNPATVRLGGDQYPCFTQQPFAFRGKTARFPEVSPVILRGRQR